MFQRRPVGLWTTRSTEFPTSPTGLHYYYEFRQSSSTQNDEGPFIGLLKEHVGKKITVILDNASIHKAKGIQHIIEFLEKQGVTLYFLPAYSPELNRIEKLWHLMKYTWMSVRCRDSKTLEVDVDEILDNFGTKYKFKF